MNIIPRSIFPSLLSALDDQRIIVLTGMRRVGKTTTLHWLLDQVPSTNKIFLDLERLDLRAVFQESNYDLVLSYLRNQGLDQSKPMTVALDEIQYVPNITSVIKYLYDQYGIKFLLTGSSSFYLKNYFTESMAGRKIVYEMFPLGFGEFLDFRTIKYRKRNLLHEMRFDPFEYERLKQHYDEYITFGGLPSVVLESRQEVKREILQDIFSSYINIDIKALADFRKINELQALLSMLTNRIGNKLDLLKISQAIGISRPTLNEYLEFLEKTYVIYRLPACARNDRAVSLGKKLYFHDNGIASILGRPGEGALFENALFNQLIPYGNLAYLAKGNSYEIDFVLTQPEGPSVGLEAKLHPVARDVEKVQKVGKANSLQENWVVGRHPIPGFDNFLWGGLFF